MSKNPDAKLKILKALYYLKGATIYQLASGYAVSCQMMSRHITAMLSGGFITPIKSEGSPFREKWRHVYYILTSQGEKYLSVEKRKYDPRRVNSYYLHEYGIRSCLAYLYFTYYKEDPKIEYRTFANICPDAIFYLKDKGYCFLFEFEWSKSPGATIKACIEKYKKVGSFNKHGLPYGTKFLWVIAHKGFDTIAMHESKNLKWEIKNNFANFMKKVKEAKLPDVHLFADIGDFRNLDKQVWCKPNGGVTNLIN